MDGKTLMTSSKKQYAQENMFYLKRFDSDKILIF